MTKPKSQACDKLICDRCNRTGAEVAGIYPFTYLAPCLPERIEYTKHEGIRLLCEDCFEYITDAMANVWPEKMVTPDVTLVETDYTVHKLSKSSRRVV